MKTQAFAVRESGECLSQVETMRAGAGGALGDQSNLIPSSILKEQSLRQNCPPSFPCNKEVWGGGVVGGNEGTGLKATEEWEMENTY